MNERLKEIFSVIPPCDTFADIGCDHGLITEAMLKSGKCRTAIVSDVSEKCLKKAEKLLADYVLEGRASSVVSDGFENLPKTDVALIAGMGGEEIALILKKAALLPETIVLQPMKNADKARTTVVSLGYRIVRDYTFLCGKIFYDLVVAVKGEDSLTEEEIEFGRTNVEVLPAAFVLKIKSRIKKLDEYIDNPALSEQTKISMAAEKDRLKKYV